MAPVMLRLLALDALVGLIALNVGAVPTTGSKPAVCGTTIVADYQGLKAPLVPLPTAAVGTYKELSYSNLFLVGMSPPLSQNPAVAIFYNGVTNANGQPSISTTVASVVKSFELLSLDVALTIAGVGGAAVNEAGKVSVIFFKTTGEQESRDCFVNQGPTGGTEIKFVTCKPDGLTNLKKVVFETSATGDEAVTTRIDNVKYKVHC